MKLSAKEKASYGLGAVGKDMVYMLSASYILYYYQDLLGVSSWVMGVILMAARIFDAFNDPIMGVIVAKTQTKWGKFRPWLLIGTVLNAVVLFFMFAVPKSVTGWGTGRLRGSALYHMGNNLYDDGYSILVNDSGFYRGRQGEREPFNTCALMRRGWLSDNHGYNDDMCTYAWQNRKFR